MSRLDAGLTNREPVDEIIDKYGSKRGSLITILQEIQKAYGYLPREKMERVSSSLKIPMSKIYGVATFYAQFHLKSRGQHIVRVCLGTACHVRGGEKILEALEGKLGIPEGETTADLKFTLEKVACLGACGLSPAMMVDDVTYGRLTPQKAQEVVHELGRG